MRRQLASLRALLVDLDGVVYRGSTLLDGSTEFFRFLNAKCLAYCLITNNATSTPTQVARKLKDLGIEIAESSIFTSGQAAARYLTRQAPVGTGVYIVGEDGLRQPLLEAGFRIDDVAPGYVVVGLDREFTYKKMAIACVAVRRGAKLIGTNPDKTFPVEEHLLPGAGALLASITSCSGARPTVVGKPSAEMLKLAIEHLGVRKRETAIVGDRLDTDVLAGKRAGITTILVLTGVASQEDLSRSRIAPDYVFRDLNELRAAMA
ncbi:MAG: HAD-IIA family hydrolase [Chloroflexi bacterium]|nr:HAD-IIA family hydrolase [Chloroflexota bacterium]MDA8186832.1 HAD-IIA family hydrolase [Dehalococcoidales bacterium]